MGIGVMGSVGGGCGEGGGGGGGSGVGKVGGGGRRAVLGRKDVEGLRKKVMLGMAVVWGESGECRRWAF